MEKPKLEGVLDHDFFDETQCRMLDNELITSFKTKINIHLDSGKKGKIEVNCIKVIIPGCVKGCGLEMLLPEITEEDAI